ncbi:hypothetical protein KC460_04660 [Candidatus Dependentiae bacterium]|nr:hypothetical protein [Candidatus Dependentiae bacterium]
MNSKQLMLSILVISSILVPNLGYCTDENTADKILSLLKKTPTAAINIFKILTAVYETKTTLDSFTTVTSNVSNSINKELLDLKKHIIKTVGETDTQIKLSMALDVIPKLLDIVEGLNNIGKQSSRLTKLLGKNLIHYIHEETGQLAVRAASRIDLTIADLESVMKQVINELVNPLKYDIARIGSILQSTPPIEQGSRQLLQILQEQQQLSNIESNSIIENQPQPSTFKDFDNPTDKAKPKLIELPDAKATDD